MTKEQSIEKVDEAIRKMKASIEDLERVKKDFIDFDENIEEIGWIDEGVELLGMWGHENGKHELLFHKPNPFYIKCIKMDENKHKTRIKNTEVDPFGEEVWYE